MKTKLSALCILSLLFAACGDKPVSAGGARKGILLTTELPPEAVEGTPPPIILPPHTPS